MSIIKNLHRVISDIEDLQNKPAKADADRTMAEIERDEARAEVERLKKELDDEMGKAGEWIDIRTHRERVAAAVARISDRARKMESERDSEKARADKATAERDRMADALRHILKGTGEPPEADDLLWAQHVARTALAEVRP